MSRKPFTHRARAAVTAAILGVSLGAPAAVYIAQGEGIWSRQSDMSSRGEGIWKTQQGEGVWAYAGEGIWKKASSSSGL